MKLLRMLFLAMLSSSVFFACSTNTKSGDENSENGEVASQACTYSYNADSTTFKWTAYKYTTRAGVSGTFDGIEVKDTKTSDNKLEVLKGAEFVIDPFSVNSGNEERDPKVVKYFFGSMANTDKITGRINMIEGNEASILVTMNDRHVDVIGHLAVEGNKVTLTAKLDMNTFDAMEAVNALNQE